MSKRVILITRRFPYFKTEAFLEAEISFLADEFDEVLVIPSEIGSEIRKVPSNVIVDNNFSLHFQNKKKRAILACFSSYFWKTLFRYRKNIEGKNDIIRILQFVSSVLCYKRYFKNFKFLPKDLVYSYWFAEATCAFVGIKEDQKKLFKIVSRAHRYDLYEGLASTPKFWPYRAWVLENIDCLFPISENGKKYLETKYGAKMNIELSKLGVFDRGLLTPNLSNKDSINLVSVSRIDPMKRVEFIAECIVHFAKANPNIDITWTHFGDGPKLVDIKNQIPQLPNLTPRLNGAVLNSEIYRFYEKTSISIFINLSSSEGIPVSIMEAQSFGIPVIATNVGGSGEIVSENTGVLLGANPTVNEVTNAIGKILELNLDRISIKSVWQSNFNAEINYKAFVKRLVEIDLS